MENCCDGHINCMAAYIIIIGSTYSQIVNACNFCVGCSMHELVILMQTYPVLFIYHVANDIALYHPLHAYFKLVQVSVFIFGLL